MGKILGLSLVLFFISCKDTTNATRTIEDLANNGQSTNTEQLPSESTDVVSDDNNNDDSKENLDKPDTNSGENAKEKEVVRNLDFFEDSYEDIDLQGVVVADSNITVDLLVINRVIVDENTEIEGIQNLIQELYDGHLDYITALENDILDIKDNIDIIEQEIAKLESNFKYEKGKKRGEINKEISDLKKDKKEDEREIKEIEILIEKHKDLVNFYS